MGGFANILIILVFMSCFWFFVESQTEYNTDVHEMWCPDVNGGCENTTLRPFKVEFTHKMIDDLKYRLKYYRPSRPTFQDVGFEYGFNTREMSKWIDYWANGYQFKKREAFLNKFPHYITNIQGLDIHFLRVTPKVPKGMEVVPLLLLHGWPGSVREFYSAIPILTAVSKDRNFAVEVVAPSLPGFAFSDAACRPGLDAEKIAVVMRNLMHRLGHKKFYVNGGDWGTLIAAHLATLFKNEVLGYHTNWGIALNGKGLLLHAAGSIFPSLVVSPSLESRMYPLVEKLLTLLRETGYLHLQSTKPDTLGIGLSDSPAGLLAYTLQFVSSNTNRSDISREDGGLSRYPKEALIDNLMMYWATNSITTSFRIYVETFNKFFSTRFLNAPTMVPTWVIQAPYEMVYQSPTILKTKFPNLLHTTVVDKGGHFLALELPRIFSQDVLAAVGGFRRWHNETCALV